MEFIVFFRLMLNWSKNLSSGVRTTYEGNIFQRNSRHRSSLMFHVFKNAWKCRNLNFFIFTHTRVQVPLLYLISVGVMLLFEGNFELSSLHPPIALETKVCFFFILFFLASPLACHGLEMKLGQDEKLNFHFCTMLVLCTSIAPQENYLFCTIKTSIGDFCEHTNSSGVKVLLTCCKYKQSPLTLEKSRGVKCLLSYP